jgi:hypothetical protein
MSIRRTYLAGGEFFHLYNRGNSKQKIFLDEEDYSRFVKLLYLSNSEYNVNFRNDIVYKHINAFDFKRGKNLIYIGSWVLMPNHFHIYIFNPNTPKHCLGVEINNITKFMLKLCTSYSKYFNKKYSRTGKLFEDKFKSVHVNKENQAKYLFSYIHLNPIKLIQNDWKEKGIKNRNECIKFLDKYNWSSYKDFTGITRNENRIIDLKNFPLNYFPNSKSFKKEIIEWLKLENEEDYTHS